MCYTVEYYSAVKKDVILPLVTTWMDPDSIVLSETGQRTRNQRFHSHVGYKTNEQTNKRDKLMATETERWLPEGKRGGGPHAR